MTTPPAPLRASGLAAYALPALPLAVVVFPSYAILPGFYAQHTQIPLATIALILVAARIFDAVVDPLIGHLSDATTSRWGARKPWIVVGAAILAVAVVRLYAPAPTVGWAYYFGWFVTFYLGYSLIEIPLKAWGTDLARNYVERSTIAGALAVAFSLGNLAFATAPFVSPSGAQAYDARTLALIGGAVAIVLPGCVLAAICLAPRGAATAGLRTNYWTFLRAATKSGPLLRFMAAFALTGLGQGLFYGLIFLYVGAVMGLGRAFAWVLLVDATVTLACLPIWHLLIRRLQKHRAWALGLAVSAAAILALWAVPAGEIALAPLLTLIGVRAFGAGVINVAPNALLGDAVDYELLKRGVNRAANFHALVSLMTKLTATAGGGLGLLLIGLAGFDPKTDNDASAVMAFKGVALALPAVILILGAIAAARFPLDRARHDVVRRRLERLAARA